MDITTEGEEAEHSQDPVTENPPGSGNVSLVTLPSSNDFLVDLEKSYPPAPTVQEDLLVLGSPCRVEIEGDIPDEALLEMVIPASETLPEATTHSPVLEKAGLDSSEPSVSSGEEEGPVLPPFTSGATQKWLNVVLDLNGVLCVCEDKRYHLYEKRFTEPREVFRNLETFTMGVKRVTIRPHCLVVLRELSKIATLSVWSSMMRKAVIGICDYLFKGLDPPLHIFGQEQCDVLKCKLGNGKIGNYKVKGTNKDLLLKPLEKLFEMRDSPFSSHNTIIVDDSPAKHITNHPKNVVLFDTSLEESRVFFYVSSRQPCFEEHELEDAFMAMEV